MLYIFRCVLTRQTRWCQNYCSIISNTEVIIEKLFHSKMPFLTFRDLWRLNGWAKVKSDVTSAKERFKSYLLLFWIWLAIIVPEIMAGIPGKTIIFRKFDLWWPLLTSIFTWAKKWPKWIRTGSLRAVDRRIARPSSFPSFRVRGGGSFWPPPPPRRRWLRPPPGRGLINQRFCSPIHIL